MRHRSILPLLILLTAAGCREDDVLGGTGGSRAYVVSDPPGAQIIVDERATGRVTPDTVRGLGGRHDITARLDTFDTSYGFNARFLFPGNDTTIDVFGPLLFRCFDVLCYRTSYFYYAANAVRFASNPVGALFQEDATGGRGLIWPVAGNGYVSGAIPVFAGLMLNDTVALGAYDTQYLAGRPAPEVTQSADSVAIRQTTWVLPPSALLQFVTARGIEVRQHIVATQRVQDALVLRLVFRNISADPLYQQVDNVMPDAGAIITNAYIGFLLDPDIGFPSDDIISYDPDLDMVFAYDADFFEENFAGGYHLKPGMVGLRVLEAPAGTNVVLNGWASQKSYSNDWKAGTPSEPIGWLLLSGTAAFTPDHNGSKIGHLPPQSGDMRVTVSAGPLTLAPGDSASITVAVLLAEPVEGTFESGEVQDPGSPLDTGRPLYDIAALLRERAAAAEALRASVR